MKTIKKAQNGTVAKDKTVVKKTVMKKQELAQKPTYKNLSMAVDVDERVTPSRGSKTPTKQDSLDYASGFKKGLSRKFEKLIPFTQISLYRKIIRVNSKSFDVLYDNYNKNIKTRKGHAN